jgi:hypothetical protein
MRVNAKDYAGQPRHDYMEAFEEALALAREAVVAQEVKSLAAQTARATASDVAGLAAALGGEAERLDVAIRRFLDGVRAA